MSTIKIRLTLLMKIDAIALGRRLRELRSSVPQDKVAGAIGVSQDMISKYESGKTKPSFEYLIWASRHAGVTIDWIITGKEPKEFAEAYAKAQAKYGELSEDENRLLNLFCEATDEMRQAAITILEINIGKQKAKNKKAIA